MYVLLEIWWNGWLFTKSVFKLPLILTILIALVTENLARKIMKHTGKQNSEYAAWKQLQCRWTSILVVSNLVNKLFPEVVVSCPRFTLYVSTVRTYSIQHWDSRTLNAYYHRARKQHIHTLLLLNILQQIIRHANCLRYSELIGQIESYLYTKKSWKHLVLRSGGRHQLSSVGYSSYSLQNMHVLDRYCHRLQ